ncbi:MAG: N-acetylmuramoyl-L-alanine amidase [Alphaproteobacteria bacterium]|nr:N-acetylmuramoyl-L-alanine amidase [Alphaproteobacteria bacterium]
MIDRRRFNQLLAVLTAGASFGQVHRALAAAPARPLIMLDAGHGGVDPGAIGVVGTYEKNIALPTVLELARQLEATRRFRITLTRRDDVFIPLEGRVARARAANADLFLSIHADALPSRAERGASVYTLSEKASDRLAAAMAASENSADRFAGIKLSHDPVVNGILFDLARRQTSNLSIRLAGDVVNHLRQHVVMLPNSHRAANFVVLKAPDIPSALVEIGCLSNRTEERDLRRPSYRTEIARALTRSINQYFDTIT